MNFYDAKQNVFNFQFSLLKYTHYDKIKQRLMKNTVQEKKNKPLQFLH